MKLWRKISLWCLIIANLFVMTSCSGGPKEVNEGKKMVDKAFSEIKEGNISNAVEYFGPQAQQELEQGYYYTGLFLLEDHISNYKEVLKDFLKDAKITYKDYEYHEEDDTYTLYYTYKGKDSEHFVEALIQLLAGDIINSPLPDIFGGIFLPGTVSTPYEDELIEIFGIEPTPGVDPSSLTPIIREAGNIYIDMNKVNFRNLEDIETEITIGVKYLEDGTLVLY